MTKQNKIDSIKELQKDQMDLMKLLKIYIALETLIHCIDSLDPEDKNYDILRNYLTARMIDLNDLLDEACLSIL